MAAPKQHRKWGGRQKGTKNKALTLLRTGTQAIVDKVGITPLEIMLDNMVFGREEAAKILQKLIARRSPTPKDFDEFQQILKFRDISQNAAKDAARYVHAPLAALDSKTGETAKDSVTFIIER